MTAIESHHVATTLSRGDSTDDYAVSWCSSAAICGVVSGPKDRYQVRLVWLASLAISLTIKSWSRDTEVKRDDSSRSNSIAKGTSV